MQWSDVLEDRCLENLPYKIELNEWGNIVMSPASNRRGQVLSAIAYHLRSQLKDGTMITQCCVGTNKGVKVADVAWCSYEFIQKHGLETPFTEAPEICVEIVSPSNHPKEMEEKIALYLDEGAREVWIVSEEGDIKYYNLTGLISASQYDVHLDLQEI